MFKPGIFEYGLKTGDLPEEEIIWNLYVTLLSDYPPKLSEDDPIQEFGGRVMEELFRTLPGEKVLINKKYESRVARDNESL